MRALPRGYRPHVGVAVLEDHQAGAREGCLPDPAGARSVGCTFSVQCGRHTHLLRADSAEDAQAGHRASLTPPACTVIAQVHTPSYFLHLGAFCSKVDTQKHGIDA